MKGETMVIHAAQGYTFSQPEHDAVGPHLRRLIAAHAASRLRAQDAGLWGPDASAEAAQRLGWVDLAVRAQSVVARARTVRAELHESGVQRIVLCGMGGSSLAPELICATAGVELTVLDSTAPDQVLTALGDRVASTAYVIASKSGGTVETDTHRRIAVSLLEAAGVDPAGRIIAITDPDSPLHRLALDQGYRVFLADPRVGGRFSALSAFGLVPSVLAGAEVRGLLAAANDVAAQLGEDSVENPALWIAATLAASHAAGAEKLLVLDDPGTPGFGAWLEQLIAESTGKLGRGVLPLSTTAEQAVRLRTAGPDFATPYAVYDAATEGSTPRSALYAIAGSGELGAQFLIWEYATALLGICLDLDPFDQPDVESAKAATRALLGEGVAALPTPPSATRESLAAFTAELGAHDYVAIQAFVDRLADPAGFEELRTRLERATGVPVTLGFGPRYLHSTGQYHKGGHPNGHFLSITAGSTADLAVPGRDFTLSQLIAAQAAGDAQVLQGLGRSVLRIHLTELSTGLAELVDLVGAL
ncbi:glucose-6-phosphate isomerase [Brevibacterium sp. 91QC2O2]|uniref:glucose-6-phosphate isomerase n=2 Tax=Brevibacterium TaxID=1696 RepID=UPI00211CC05A|nr:glucose-6-phosphate isomerase [Brevibacterium sp. 68QC2CO]MCQ9366827.1 glucose-6-phosphate isomerase [Brevibacterium sp. 91QC2O2]MCQ9383977.1 glucose-6-phosphate isomerase [Brevibacterium sp. 68QC2CO]